MTRKIYQAAFFWKNDKPGGLGLTLGWPSFSPDELTEMFTGPGIKKCLADSDGALGTKGVQTYLDQLAAIAAVKHKATLSQTMLAALNIMWLVERGFIPNDEFNGYQFAVVEEPAP